MTDFRQTNRLLWIYFAARFDWPMTTPLGRDPSASRTVGGDASRLLRLCVDIGAALATLIRLAGAVMMGDSG